MGTLRLETGVQQVDTLESCPFIYTSKCETFSTRDLAGYPGAMKKTNSLPFQTLEMPFLCQVYFLEKSECLLVFGKAKRGWFG